MEEFHRDGQPTSIAGLARAAGVSRSWIYTQPDLLQQLQRHNQTARKPRLGPAERASDASLLTLSIRVTGCIGAADDVGDEGLSDIMDFDVARLGRADQERECSVRG